MPRVLLSTLADRDLELIEEIGLLRFGRHQRDRYMLSLIDALERIGHFPEIGRKSQRPDIRRLLHGTHVIFYSLAADSVLIRRIMDARVHGPEHDL